MRRRAVVLLIGAAVLALGGAIAWRWMPRPAIPPTAEMLQADAQAARSATAPAPSPWTPPANPRSDRDRLLVAASSLKGKPYEWGAKGPDAYDCSGFTKAAYAMVAVALPDGSFNQAKGERPLADPAHLKPGDLILYRWSRDSGVKHVTMYAGGGWVIGTGTPGQPSEVAVYPFAGDLAADGWILTYRHIRLPDER